jgi:hypothetical protein
MRNLLALLLLFALMTTACHTENSADVNQDRIFTQYELFYNANEDITYARAWFRFGSATGTQLELTSPSQVEFEGDKLSFVKLLGYYEKKIAGYKKSGTFKWEDTAGAAFENTVTIHEINYGAVPDSVSRTGAFSIPWTGDPLGDTELVGAWINGEKEGDAQAAATIEKGASALIIPADKMAKIGAGTGTIYMDRRFSPELEQATSAGGTGTGIYRPKNKTVIFK